MKLYLMKNEWIGEYHLVAAESKDRATEIVDKEFVEGLKQAKQNCMKDNYDYQWVDDFLDNQKERYRLYSGEEFEQDLKCEGIVNSFHSID